MGGCYEEHAATPEPQPVPEPAPVEQPASGRGSATEVASPPGSALGGARRAAQNTVDDIEQRQRELEKSLEDQQ
jgi:hypothetical protein